MRSTGRLAAVVSALLLLGALVVLAVPAVGIATGRWRLLPILSGSMAPRLPAGSLALTTRSPEASIRAGDVIVFNIPIGDHHLTAHRVVRVLSGGPHPVVETKGDANTTPDPWRLRLNGTTAWIVRAHIPFVGYAAVFTRRWGFQLLGVGALALLAVCLRYLWRPERASADTTLAAHAANQP
ncbi:MAG TPA: signal peptidase I [Gaiellaceae bacterium]|nr:signal peptidase I [Gaiellaceae bacterium]